MRQVRYSVASSLDGYIAGVNGEFDWIPSEPTIDFASLFAKVDTVLVGRTTYEATMRLGGGPWKRRTRVYVFSNTLHQFDHPKVTIVHGNDAAAIVENLRGEEGDGEIWLFGGGRLFRSLLALGQVDRVEVTVCPVLLGGGAPLLWPSPPRAALRLVETKAYPSGMVALSYAVPSAQAASGS